MEQYRVSALLFDWYKSLKKQQKIWTENLAEGMGGAKWQLDEINLSIETLDMADSNLAEEYRRFEVMQKSFSPDQIDFICYQIGEWYLNWKERIVVDLEAGTHRLGYAKELLKEMICGE